MLIEWMMAGSKWAVPGFVFLILAHAFYKRVNVFEAFVEGAKEGFSVAVRLLPYLTGLFVAIAVFRDSGAMQLITRVLGPVLKVLGVPAEVVPIMVVRPLSGVAALALTVDLMNQVGPDSFVGRLAATLEGSTDTTLYITAVYFASVGVKKARYSIAVGLLSDLVGFMAATYITWRVFG